MNSAKTYLLCLIMVPLVISAGRPGGKWNRNDNRKFSKANLRFGPDKKTLTRQNAWEKLQAKKTQSAHTATTRSERELPYENISTHDLLTRCQQSSQHRTTHRPKFTQSSKATLLLTLLLITQCSGAPHYYTDKNALHGCMHMQNHIIAHKADFDGIREIAQKHPDQFGEVTFPETPTLHCPDPNQQRPAFWTVDHARDWYKVGQSFLDAFKQAQGELNGRINAYNNRPAYKEILHVYNYLDGKIHSLKPEYENTFAELTKDQEAFLSQPPEKFDTDPLVKMGNIIDKYTKQVTPVTTTWGSVQHFLKLMAADDTYVDIAEEIIQELAEGSYQISSYAQMVLTKNNSPEQLASRLALSIGMAKKLGVDIPHLQARLNELQLGLLHAGEPLPYNPEDMIVSCKGDADGTSNCESFMPGLRILCSREDICGISDAIAAQLRGTKLDIVRVDALLKDISGRVDSAQDVRRIFMNGNDYVGQPYIPDNGPVDPRLRIVEGDQQAAEQIFQFCTRDNEFSQSLKQGSLVSKLRLEDETEITLWPPTTGNEDSIIVIENIPAWISSNWVAFRFQE